MVWSVVAQDRGVRVVVIKSLFVDGWVGLATGLRHATQTARGADAVDLATALEQHARLGCSGCDVGWQTANHVCARLVSQRVPIARASLVVHVGGKSGDRAGLRCEQDILVASGVEVGSGPCS